MVHAVMERFGFGQPADVFVRQVLLYLDLPLLYLPCFLVSRFGSRFKDKKLANILAFALLAYMSWNVYEVTSTGSTFISFMLLPAVLCTATFILGFIKLTFFDYMVMFSAFTLLRASGFGTRFEEPLNYIWILVTLSFISYNRLRKIKGHIFHIWLNFVIVILLYEGVIFCFDGVVRYIGYSFSSSIIKIIVWGVSSLIIAGISAGIILIVKYLCHDYFDEINEMGRNFPSIERRFITVSTGILIIYASAGALIYAFIRNRYSIEPILKTVYFLSVFIELWFLTQMFHLSHLRESLRDKEIENMSLLHYSTDLEKNISDIKDIKHDVKNLFFTMGQFVERSGDNDFMDFYRNEIVPFAKDEIQKNDLYASLLPLNNEQFRAFLHYKLTQAIKLGVPASVEIVNAPKSFSINIRLSDFVRILGILIDNAFEESLLLGNGEGRVIISITGNDQADSIKIRNKIRPETLSMGVKPGMSQKGGDRGRGLKIADEILSKYDYAALNSYFQEGWFVQNLVVYKK